MTALSKNRFGDSVSFSLGGDLSCLTFHGQFEGKGYYFSCERTIYTNGASDLRNLVM